MRVPRHAASLWSGNLRLSLVLIPVKAACRQAPDEEIIKGYEHAKGHHVLIHPKELDELKLEAKHTIDMVRFVDAAEIDARYKEKP